jgi:hypothetical protein
MPSREAFLTRFFSAVEKIWKSVASFHRGMAARVEKIHRFRLHIAGQDVELHSLLESELKHGACN